MIDVDTHIGAASLIFSYCAPLIRPVCGTGGQIGKEQQAHHVESPTRPPADTRPLPETGGKSPPSELALQQLQAMGFQRHRAAAALAASGDDLVAAANMLAGDACS